MLLTAEPAPRSALELIKAEGQLVLTDNASFFVFKADGTFQSSPNGMSGRTLSGTWKSQPGETLIEVIALQSWMNGVSGKDDYRKLVFAIYQGSTRAFTPSPGGESFKRVFDGYWFIEEATRAPKPKK